MKIRRAEDRGPSNLGWLDSKHTFCFGHYHDPKHMGFETLRVINDDKVEAGAGFATHPHDNMEIISYVLEGALEHKDSMGNGSIIKPGEVQRLSAGTGITHSEYNHSKDQQVHFLQIWFLPEKRDIEPGYAQKAFSEAEKRGKFKLVASREGRDGSVSLNQDVDMSVALLDGSERTSYKISNDRAAWLHIARGSVSVDGQELKEGDGASISEPTELDFTDAKNAEIIIFDMAKLA